MKIQMSRKKVCFGLMATFFATRTELENGSICYPCSKRAEKRLAEGKGFDRERLIGVLHKGEIIALDEDEAKELGMAEVNTQWYNHTDLKEWANRA